MGLIGDSVVGNLKGLSRFSGRQTPSEFWPYALIAFGIGLLVGMAGFMGPLLEAMGKMQEYAQAHPEHDGQQAWQSSQPAVVQPTCDCRRQ